MWVAQRSWFPSHGVMGKPWQPQTGCHWACLWPCLQPAPCLAHLLLPSPGPVLNSEGSVWTLIASFVCLPLWLFILGHYLRNPWSFFLVPVSALIAAIWANLPKGASVEKRGSGESKTGTQDTPGIGMGILLHRTALYLLMASWPHLRALRYPLCVTSDFNSDHRFLPAVTSRWSVMVTQLLLLWYNSRWSLSMTSCQLKLVYVNFINSSISWNRNCCCFSVAKPLPTLCDPMDCSMPGFPVLHHLPEFAQTHVRRVGDAIQPSRPLLPSSPPAFNLSQHQSLFQWVGFLHQVAKVLELQFQHQTFQGIFRVDFLEDWLVWSPCCPRDSQESSPALQFQSINFWGSAFFMVQLSHPHMTKGCNSPNVSSLSKATKVMSSWAIGQVPLGDWDSPLFCATWYKVWLCLCNRELQ